MMAKWIYTAILILMVISKYGRLYAQQEQHTNVGTEFIVMFLEDVRDGYPLQISMTTTLSQSVEVIVKTPLWQSPHSVDTTVIVEPEEIKFVHFNESLRMFGDGIENKSVIVKASGEIVLFATNFQWNTADSYIIYPTSIADTEYVAISYEDINTIRSRMGCVAISNQTNINITVPKRHLLKFEGKIYRFNEMIHFTFDQYQSFQIKSADVTGAVIISDKPVVCFSGTKYVNAACNKVAVGSDHIEEQLLPVSAWSSRYFVISDPAYVEGAGVIVRIVSFYNDSFIGIETEMQNQVQNNSVHSCLTLTLNQGMYHEFFLNPGTSAIIASDKPILVAQLSCTRGRGEKLGDITLFLSLSDGSFLPNYTFITPALHIIEPYNYGLVVVTHTKTKDSIIFDGVNLSTVLSWYQIQRSDYFYGICTIEGGIHNVYSNSGNVFGGYVYGYVGLTEFATAIGRDISKPKYRKVTAPVESTEATYRTGNFRFIGENTIPEVKEMGILYTESLYLCLQTCVNYSNCFGVSHTINGLCLIYGYESRCCKMKYYAGNVFYLIY